MPKFTNALWDHQLSVEPETTHQFCPQGALHMGLGMPAVANAHADQGGKERLSKERENPLPWEVRSLSVELIHKGQGDGSWRGRLGPPKAMQGHLYLLLHLDLPELCHAILRSPCNRDIAQFWHTQ